jgi:hypothetical protein
MVVNTLLFIAIGYTGCRPIRETRERFQYTKFCYTPGKKIVDKISTGGYYEFSYSYLAHKGGANDTSLTHAINTCTFFDDGTFIYNFTTRSLEQGVDPDSKNYSRFKHWGTWTISNDTVKSQYLEPPGGMSWSRQQIWFKVIDRNNLEWLAQGSEITASDIKAYKVSAGALGRNKGHFVTFSPLPDPQKSWLMERKWFWCDQKQYQEWKSKRED